MGQVVAGYGDNDIVLNGVDLAARRGFITVILGPNGSGKSTALRVLSGFLRSRSGTVEMNGEDIADLSPRDRIAAGMAFLPQGRSIFPSLTVEENVRLGAWLLRRDARRHQAAVDGVFARYPSLRALGISLLPV